MTNVKLSANLGFLFTELALPDAIEAARASGFEAVELHWPYDNDPKDIRAALDATGLPVVGLNTVKGLRDGDVGLSAQIGREQEARSAIDQAFDYGRAIGAGAVHVMAGTRGDQDPHDCVEVFAENLTYACDRARDAGMMTLIEPLNPYDNPDYVLIGLENAVAMIERVRRPELKIMFDCYHVQITDGDLSRRFNRVCSMVGHVQFAGVPDRGEPDRGEVAYERLLPALAEVGYTGLFGAEYRPSGRTGKTLDWMRSFVSWGCETIQSFEP